ncbi:S-adenosyl-L-methionine-dependent methyltransferase [Syncephalis fuscata]|nr:S-adenosyl-L-methionine-dependent methyltransferase [Syncephalis fuscata]
MDFLKLFSLSRNSSSSGLRSRAGTKSDSGSSGRKKDHSNGSHGSNGSDGEFVYKNGRRYHGISEAPYPLPNDIVEMDRLDSQHYMFQLVTRRKYHVPLENPHAVIDIGTGTGTWLMDMASDYPSCDFIGIDIAPLQPQTVLPPNCRFELQNLLEGLTYPANSFDFVRHRMLVGAIPGDRWIPYVRDCARITSPGGWVEMSDMNGLIADTGPCAIRLRLYFNYAVQQRNIDLGMIKNVGLFMKDAGQLGQMAWSNLRQGIVAMKPLIVLTSNVTPETIDEFLEELEEEVNERRSCCQLWVHIGQKPI